MTSDPRAVAPYLALCKRPADAVLRDLEFYAHLLAKWQRVQNLVSRETLDQVWQRHFADSLQTLRYLRSDDRRFLDLGSGGGFPALPMAIALKGSDAHFMLVEPTSRKVSFLRTVARDLGLAVTVIDKRSEQIDPRETSGFDLITSRALAGLPALCAMAAPFFGPQTRALFHKGREHVEELAESAALWHHDVVIHKSDTDPNGVLIELSKLSLKNR